MSRLQLFGTPMLETMMGREPLPALRPYQLLAYLACRGIWVSRDAVAALFWPDRDNSNARANLRFVLVQIRRLEHVGHVEMRTNSLRWPSDSDVLRFERAAVDHRWEDAIAEYRGPLLEGLELGAPAPYIEWLQFERARLHALWRDCLAARLEQLGDDAAACAALAGRAMQSDPLDETTLAFQLRALAALGRLGEARRAYSDYTRNLATELGIEPSAALRDLMRRFESQQPGAPLAIVAGDRASTLAASGDLVGRRTELGHLRQLMLGEECRLLTINGPGGVGKSALARAALPRLTAEFGDGAFWIALDDLQSIEQVVPRCTSALGIELRADGPSPQQLIEQLRDARALLVFDNAEHLPGFAAWLGALLAACDRLKVLVTSRARLDLAGEWLLPLEGLPVPDGDESEVDVLRAFDAVRLFEVRASRVQPDFDARAHAGEVAALVRAVAGLPLAIELAAAWVRLLPVAEIRRELSRSLDLLDDADARRGRTHSVRDSFEHSWRLLVPPEQRALLRMAVFQGDFSREAAQAVADAALPLLATLADKSLLRTTEQGRFAFHPLIQQFALEKLAQSGANEELEARTRHAEHFLMLLARYNEFHALDQRAALQAIGVEIENMLTAWRWAIAQRRIDLLGNCASALESYLDARGQQHFGLEQFTLAAAVIDDALPAHQLARCHVQLARAAFCYRRGDFPEGELAARAALQAAHRIKYRFGVKSSTNTLGLMLWRLGHTKEAAFCLRDVLRRARADAEFAAVPLYALNLGRIELELGNDDEGERLLQEALDESRRNGNLVGVQAGLNELCSVQLDQQRPQTVLSLAQEGLALCESSGFRRNAPYFHRALAEAYFALNDLASSAMHARSALDAIRSGGDRTLEPACRVRLAWIALHAGELSTALAELKAAGGVAKSMRSPRVQVEVVAAFARFCRGRDPPGQSRELLALVLHHPAATRRQRESAAAELAAWPATTDAAEPTPDHQPVSLDQALDRLLAEPL